MGQEQKRFQKKKERERAVARKLQQQRAFKQYSSTYPLFIYDPKLSNSAQVPEQFVKAVRAACKRIRFDNDELFYAEEQEAYRLVKKKGHNYIEKWIEESENKVEVAQSLSGYVCTVGTVVFNLIGEEQLVKWLPYNDVRFIPFNGDFVIQFRSLKQKSSPGGIIYHSSNKPKIVVDGKPKIVGFSAHAIQQVCSRIVPTWRTYGGIGDAFAIFEQCKHYELAPILNEAHAFTWFDICNQGFFSWQYVKELIGESAKTDGYYYFRVGYCPAVIEGEFIKAKTLLCSGYHGTPEYSAMMRSGILSNEERSKMQEQVHQFNVQALRETKDFSLLKWFHNNGVPQVVWSAEKWYGA